MSNAGCKVQTEDAKIEFYGLQKLGWGLKVVHPCKYTSICAFTDMQYWCWHIDTAVLSLALSYPLLCNVWNIINYGDTYTVITGAFTGMQHVFNDYRCYHKVVQWVHASFVSSSLQAILPVWVKHTVTLYTERLCGLCDVPLRIYQFALFLITA